MFYAGETCNIFYFPLLFSGLWYHILIHRRISAFRGMHKECIRYRSCCLQMRFRGLCSPTGFRISLNRKLWLVLRFKTAKCRLLRGGSYLLKSKAADFLDCGAAAVTPPTTVSLREADMCEITCRDQIRPCRNTVNNRHAAQPPTDVWFRSSEPFSCQEPYIDTLQDTDRQLIRCFLCKHQLRGLLSLDMTLDLDCNCLHCRWGRTFYHQNIFHRFSQRDVMEHQNNKIQLFVILWGQQPEN